MIRFMKLAQMRLNLQQSDLQTTSRCLIKYNVIVPYPTRQCPMQLQHTMLHTCDDKCYVHYHAYNAFNEICYLYHVNLPRMALLRCEIKTLIRLKLPLYEHNIPSFQDVVM